MAPRATRRSVALGAGFAAEIDMDAVLARPRLGHLLQAKVHRGTFAAQEHELAVVAEHLEIQRRCPEPGEPLRILAVNGDHADIKSHSRTVPATYDIAAVPVSGR
nr:hypothetical protein [Fodinicola feengrottensis]